MVCLKCLHVTRHWPFPNPAIWVVPATSAGDGIRPGPPGRTASVAKDRGTPGVESLAHLGSSSNHRDTELPSHCHPSPGARCAAVRSSPIGHLRGSPRYPTPLPSRLQTSPAVPLADCASSAPSPLRAASPPLPRSTARARHRQLSQSTASTPHRFPDASPHSTSHPPHSPLLLDHFPCALPQPTGPTLHGGHEPPNTRHRPARLTGLAHQARR